ncbi:MAG TPA: hypothetical protein PLK06_03580 [bacterium]|nr:hypothetical protein [bacterium]
MKADTGNLGRAFLYSFRGKEFAVTNWEEFKEHKDAWNSDTVIKRVIDTCEKAMRPLAVDYPEVCLRVTWTKATRCYPSRPCAELVTVVDWEYSPAYAITDNGQKIMKKTLYRMPKQARIADIFAKRDER